jgi:hypothetical protein
VTSLLEKEESGVPQWIKDGSKAMKGGSSAEEMRNHLRHIVLPHSIHSYQQLRQVLLPPRKVGENGTGIGEVEAITCLPQRDKSDKTEFNMTSLSSVTTADPRSLQDLRNFFDQVKSGDNPGKSDL